MNEIEKCSISGCGSPALILSQPPRCLSHVEDVDGWYESLDEIISSSTDNSWKLTMSAISHNLYREYLFTDSIGEELYRDFKKRVNPSDDIEFLFVDVVYFVLLAATSGIVGNFAYDAIKTIIRKIKDRDNDLEKEFSNVIRVAKYEELRSLKHPDNSAQLIVDVEIELRIKKKYHLLIQEWETKDSNVQNYNDER